MRSLLYGALARLNEVNTRNDVLLPPALGHKITLMRPVAFGEALPAGTRLTLVSDDKPDRLFRVIKFWMDETAGTELTLKTGVPSYQFEDGLPRRRLGGGGRKAESIYCFTCRSMDKMKTGGASGGPSRPALIQDRSLRAH